MIIPPVHLLLFWTVFGGIAFAMSIRKGTEAARANIEVVTALSQGYSISYLDSLLVFGVSVLSALCLIASIYAVCKIKELLEG